LGLFSTHPFNKNLLLKGCIINKSELTNLIVGGDWNCTLTKKDKGGTPWKPTQFRHLILMTMEIFDLMDI